MKFENANVLITGGASGIGKIMGRMALEKGAKCFIIWDINLAGIEAARKELGRFGKVKGYVVDVSNYEVVNLAYSKAVEDCGEIDIVINVGELLEGRLDEMASEIEVLREEASDVVLKVIIESGALKTPELIRKASLLSMMAGTDFVKTSTGKIDVAATPEAAVVMCEAIRDYYEKTGRKVGFKAAGGVRTAEDAALYYTIVEQTLGKEWLTPELFRIGASSVANNLISAIEGKEIKYF